MRLSVTNLDRLTYYRNAEYVSPSVQQVVDEIRGVGREETDAMRRGTAFHEIMETAQDGQLSFVDHGGYTFKFELGETLCLPPIAELKGELYLSVGGVPVTLSGKVDAIDGLTVYDHKLSKKFDHEMYEDSMQWRCYLAIFGATRFVYNVFVAAEKKGVVTVKALHQLEMFSYPLLEVDVLNAVTDFVEFCKQHCPDVLEDDTLDRKQLI